MIDASGLEQAVLATLPDTVLAAALRRRVDGLAAGDSEASFTDGPSPAA